MNRFQQNQYEPTWLCDACGVDFRNWMQLPGEDRREFVRQRPGWEITLLIDDCCPACGKPYPEPRPQSG